MKHETIIHICGANRATEVALLLQSLRTQTYQDFDILLLDDGSSVPHTNFYFNTYLINRLKFENHGVTVIRNNMPSGVWRARQQLVDYTMKHDDYKYIVRLDDDVIIEPDFLEKLKQVIDEGYDCASGVTTPFASPDLKRETRFVKPIIGECILDKEGNLIKNGDDCGCGYVDEEIIPTHHFRSCAMYKIDIHKAGIDYVCRLGPHGFREEQIFSFKMILGGFKIGVHTGANARHLMTPSGGERPTTNMTGENQKVFEETVKRMFLDHGDFLGDYSKKILGYVPEIDKEALKKSTNLVEIK